MKVAVVGSRSITNAEIDRLIPPDTTLIVSGGPGSGNTIVVSGGPGSGNSAVSTRGPGSGSSAVSAGGPGPSGEEGAGEEKGAVYNALLVVLDPEQANEMKSFMGKAIFFMNHRAGDIPESEENVLQAGLEGVDEEMLLSVWNAPGAPQTADDLIASFGFTEGLEKNEMSRGPGAAMDAEEPDHSVHAALEWVRENRTRMERLNVPFFMNVHLDHPASPASSQETRDYGEETLASLIEGLEEEGLLERTVLFCTVKGTLPGETVPMMILHPEWPEGAVVDEQTSHMDVLPTILELNRVSGESRQRLLKELPGRDLLNMAADTENEQRNTEE